MGWKDILKVLPPEDWDEYGGYTEVDGTHVQFTPKRKDYGTIAVIVRGHYQDRIINNTNNHGTSARNTDEMERWVDCVINLPAGNYWFYKNNNPKSHAIILVDIIVQGDKLPNTKDKVLNQSIKNADGEVITKMIIFTNYFNNRRGVITGRKFVPCNGQDSLKELNKPKPKKQKEPIDIFSMKPNLRGSVRQQRPQQRRRRRR